MQLNPQGSNSNNHNEPNLTNNDHNMFFANLLSSLPAWDNAGANALGGYNPMEEFNFSNGNLLGPIGSHSMVNHQANDFLGPIGTAPLTPSISPHTTSSNSSNANNGAAHYGVACGSCELLAGSRCLDCNDALCDDCTVNHQRSSFSREHNVVPMSNLSPNGSNPVPSVSTGASPNHSDPQCDVHGEVLRYVCESCRKIVCQECTLWEHKEHNCVAVSLYADNAENKIAMILDSGKLGTKYIKASIDRAVAFTQSVERDALDACQRVRKAMRLFILAAEDRERALLDRVEKMKVQKMTSLSDQMAGLRAALSGLAQTSETLHKTVGEVHSMSAIELSQVLTRGENQMEQYAAMYKSLQPKEEFLTFLPPNFEMIQEIRTQGDIVMMNHRTGSSPILSPAAGMISRRPIVRTGPAAIAPSSISAWELSNTLMPALPMPTGSCIQNIGQCIPGSTLHVAAQPAFATSTSFGFDGHEDGQVSRPWGLCVDKDGNIIVADRRNNRVQVFYPDATFKLKFGTKGSGNGQFDLPAGISTDPQNRIVVVDKDNHRIQIFNPNGVFILKFGSYGKDCGQFQYPWDIAVNTKGEMLVTDSRNHRIQLFNPDGHFISRFSFDGINHTRSLKGLTTPRGVCFTPMGDIIVSDFENHRLLLIDSNLNKILATKGHEGTGVQEFCRPSGICCDDEGRVIVADSKNQRVLYFSPQLEFLWAVEVRPSSHPLMPITIDEKDRPSDLALMPDGRLVVMVETSPDARDTSNPSKTFIQIY